MLRRAIERVIHARRMEAPMAAAPSTIRVDVPRVVSADLGGQGIVAEPRPPLPDTVPSEPSGAASEPAGAASEPAAAAWTLDGWLASQDRLTRTVAAALASAVPESMSPLDFLRCDACTREVIEEGLEAARLGGLVEDVWAAVERLRGASTAEELQAKFLQEGVGALSYANLSKFFGGLEGIVGAPSPKVEAAMAAEHTEREDSQEEFNTPNYDVTTTSAVEWRFVAEPDSAPSGGWPVEGRLEAAHDEERRTGRRNTLLRSGAEKRRPMALADLQSLADARNARLTALHEPPITIAEALGARLYTGPLFVKYNGVLRGLDSEVAVLRRAMVRLCCGRRPKPGAAGGAADDRDRRGEEEGRERAQELERVSEAFEAGRLSYEEVKSRHLNMYATTLHAINSSIVKLAKLAVAAKVYRGVSGRVLPAEFWRPNEFDVRGGVEGAFMSTTLDREVAMSYAGRSGSAGFVFEIQQGMVDRGADVSFLSQYPHEREILFAPLTGLEVQSTRVEGTVMVVAIKLSVNLA
jgi:hypothetical protein